MVTTTKFGIALPDITEKKGKTIDNLTPNFQVLDNFALTGEGPLDLLEIASPGSPVAGRLKVFAESDDRLHIKNSAGLELLVGNSDFNGEVALDLNEVTALALGYNDPSGATAGGVGKALFSRFICLNSIVVNELNFDFSAVGHFKAAIYSDSSGSPNIPLSQSADTRAVMGWNITPITPISITSGQYYWIALVLDAKASILRNAAGGTGYNKSVTYNSFTFPNPWASTGYASDVYLPCEFADALPAVPATGRLKVYAKNDDRLHIKNSAGLELAVGNLNLEQALDLNEVTTPTVPSGGRIKFYAKSDNQLYSETSAGAECPIGKNKGMLPFADDGSVGPNLAGWSKFQLLIGQSIDQGRLFSADIVTTYSTVNTAGFYFGGVMGPSGSVHFVPYVASVGQKISPAGIVSTYALVYTNSTGAYAGGVLAPDGSIHFVPSGAPVGQKVSVTGVVSTYALVYTNSSKAYVGGILAPDGSITFVPCTATVGQMINPSGVVQTYALAYTTDQAYIGGVLDAEGNTHFVPYNASVGQMITADGQFIITYALAYTTAGAYSGGVLAPDGSIHFVPYNATMGQMITASELIYTYALAYATAGAYFGGVLASDGSVHFVPYNAPYGQKISAAGVISLYAIAAFTNYGYCGGVLALDGSINFINFSAVLGQKVTTTSALPFSLGTCCCPFLNKF